ncbi:hypothetical protein NW762_002182 [Fusarium torreyae]|uniref:Kelch repeat protein n=1 Tax=Fusarium torreyae TaxID=1237075 RepID=A0A9W8SGZ0_9HYPO|nr:hypothetical protein NW762_002182 [Fusarium torreyae]
MTTGKWTNESSKALGYATWSGVATCIPTIGSEGLLVFMGGAKTEMPGWTNTSDPVSFSNITIYDPSSKEWYSQLSTGGPPEPRVDFCSVGVAGPNGTYEIYIYGGWNTWYSKTKSFGDVWVLSLPGFRWFKADNEAPRRAMHGCALAGNRQMLSIGGNDNIQKGGWRDKDPWKQGIGILDLPSMTWSNEYDADASKYDSPEVVKNWYSGGEAAQWDHGEVAKLFASMTTDTTESTTTNDPASESTDSSSSTPVGAIAGGVVGGLALLGAIAGVWFFMRRRARTAPGTQVRRASWAKAELHGESSEGPLVLYELDSQRSRAELPVDKATERKKPQASQRYEMPG